jgi:hypothetical protein
MTLVLMTEEGNGSAASGNRVIISGNFIYHLHFETVY